MKEINSSDLDMHEAYPPDVVVLLYDITDTSSFSFIADIFLVNVKQTNLKKLCKVTKK